MSANVFGFGAGGSYQNARVWALNKAQMYAGNPTVQVLSFDAPSAEFTVLPSNARLQTGTPPAGSPNYFSVVAQFLNTVSVYKFHVDWKNISTSTFSGPFLSLTATSWSQLLAAKSSHDLRAGQDRRREPVSFVLFYRATDAGSKIYRRADLSRDWRRKLFPRIRHRQSGDRRRISDSCRE